MSKVSTPSPARLRSDLAANDGAGLIGFKASGADAVLRDIQAKGREILSAPDYGVLNDGTVQGVGAGDALGKLATYAKSIGAAIYFPSGQYLFNSNLPFRQEGVLPAGLEDWKGVEIVGDGLSTEIGTRVTGSGADVFQLNGIKNFSLKNILITSQITAPAGSWSGSNAVSITAGGENIQVKGVSAFDLPYRDAGAFGDGGKAFTVQPSTSANPIRNIIIEGNHADNCLYGFGMDLNGLKMGSNAPKQIRVAGNSFSNVFRGVSCGYSDDATLSDLRFPQVDVLVIGNQILNAQYGLFAARMSGVLAVGNSLISTDISAPTWLASDTVRRAVHLAGVWYSAVRGNRIYYADCETFIAYGGTTSAGGAIAYSQFNNIAANICGGVASDYGMKAINAGGNIARDSDILDNVIQGGALGEIDQLFYASAYNNSIRKTDYVRTPELAVNTTGPQNLTGCEAVVNGDLGLANADGKNAHQYIRRNGMGVAIGQNGSSSPTNRNAVVEDNTGATKFAIRNDGQLVGVRASSGAVGAAAGYILFEDVGGTTYKIPLHV